MKQAGRDAPTVQNEIAFNRLNSFGNPKLPP
jgi:hypothetical protein